MRALFFPCRAWLWRLVGNSATALSYDHRYCQGSGSDKQEQALDGKHGVFEGVL